MTSKSPGTVNLLFWGAGLWIGSALMLGGFVTFGLIPWRSGLIFFIQGLQLIMLAFPGGVIVNAFVRGKHSIPVKTLGVLLLAGYGAFCFWALFRLLTPHLEQNLNGWGQSVVWLLQLFSADLGVELGKLVVGWVRRQR